MNDLEIKLAKLNNIADKLFERELIALIRLRYSENDELAILRKKLAGINDVQFDEYNAYVEQCKTELKTKLGFI